MKLRTNTKLFSLGVGTAVVGAEAVAGVALVTH